VLKSAPPLRSQSFQVSISFG